MFYHEACLHEIHSGIALDKTVKAVKSNPQASHWHISWRFPSTKTSLGRCCNHCTTMVFMSSSNLNLHPLALSWGGWTHGSKMAIALGCTGHLSTHEAHCALDSVSHMEMAITMQTKPFWFPLRKLLLVSSCNKMCKFSWTLFPYAYWFTSFAMALQEVHLT
jgi:hypothetical protein